MTRNCIGQVRMVMSVGATQERFPTELVNAVEGTATLIANALEPGNRSPLATGWVRDILVKHGVLKS